MKHRLLQTPCVSILFGMTSRCGSTRTMLRARTSVDAIPPRLQGLTLPAAPRMLTWSSSGLGSIGLQP